MSKFNYVNIHLGLIIYYTDKATLIEIPKKINDEKWNVWIPDTMLKESDNPNEMKFKFPKNWEFNLVHSNDRKTKKSITVEEFKNIFEKYDTSHLDDLLLINRIEESIDYLEKRIRVLKSSMSLMQEIQNLPNEIDELISESDLSDLDLLVDNIKLAKERYKNE